MGKISIGLKTLIIPEGLRDVMNGLSTETKDYLIAWALIAGGRNEDDLKEWAGKFIHADILTSLWEQLKAGEWTIKYTEDENES